MKDFDLVHGRDKMWDFVNTVMNFQGPINCGEFFELPWITTSKKPLYAVSSVFKAFSYAVLNSYLV